MNLFTEDSRCPVCGAKLSWLLPWKIGGEFVCDACYKKLDIEAGRINDLTMDGFREYLQFYDQNQLLKNQFTASQQVDFGFLGLQLVFDYPHRLFCMSRDLDKTVFEGRQLKSFTIKEDSVALFEGSEEGILRHCSTVPRRVAELEPHITQFVLSKQLTHTLDRMEELRKSSALPFLNVREPFRSFKVELHLDHPYWTTIQCDVCGPRMNSANPSAAGYLCDYQHSIAQIERLVAALRTVAFPDAPQLPAEPCVEETPLQAAAVLPMDTLRKIKKYKKLMESGIISPKEYDAKRRQLLGM